MPDDTLLSDEELCKLVRDAAVDDNSDAFIAAIGRLHDLAPALARCVLAQAAALREARTALEAVRPEVEPEEQVTTVATGETRTTQWCHCRSWTPHEEGCIAIFIDKALASIGEEGQDGTH